MAGEKLIRRALQAAREAAKPLPMDEASRMARAEALNFNPTTFYHATSQEFPAFDMRRAGEGATIGKGERAAFLVNRPAVADSYLGGQYVNRENAAASGFSTADMGGNGGLYGGGGGAGGGGATTGNGGNGAQGAIIIIYEEARTMKSTAFYIK